jgi:hypothetical protein
MENASKDARVALAQTRSIKVRPSAEDRTSSQLMFRRTAGKFVDFP